MSYDLGQVSAPRLSGAALRAFAWALESSPARGLLARRLLRNAGVDAFRRLELSEGPGVRPDLPLASPEPRGVGQALDLAGLAQLFEQARGDEPPRGIQALRAAYQSGASDPRAVAERFLEGLAASEDVQLRVLIAQDPADLRAQAEASAARWAAGEPIGPLDGIPVAIKDQIDQAGYPTTAGTTFLARGAARVDSCVAARLRAAGALLVGKTNMHEIGIGTTGLNPHYGAVRNPYGLGHYSGGSSSGSAAIVAAGLCPLAIGSDGGGSIRIPAALCGVAGLKPTFGRVSKAGGYPLCWSVGHVGPIASSLADLSLGYAAIAGADPADSSSLGQPDPDLAGLDSLDLSGVRVGLYRPWFEDAEQPVVSACREALAWLEAAGAEVREVDLPDLEMARVAHAITITSEMNASLESVYATHRSEFGLDVRVTLAATRRLTGRDYIRAQRARTRFLSRCVALYEGIDLLATPTTACVAPPIPPEALPDGISDLGTIAGLMRYAFPGNLTGYPAISVPVGHQEGLPIGFQLMARPWAESLLLRAGRVLEARAPVREPAWQRSLLA